MPAPRSFDEQALEAFLDGRSNPAADTGPLAAFAEDLRTVVSGPPPAASPLLAQLLTRGISTDALSALADPAGPSTAERPTRRRLTMIKNTLAARAAKVAGLGAIAKLALGVGVAAAAVTTAGAANVLPDPAQNAVATVVNAATPLHIDGAHHHGHSGNHVTDAVTDASTDDETGTIGDDTGTTGDDTGVAGQPTDNHGACVSAIAKSAPTGQGSDHGAAVSEAAKNCPKAHDDATPAPAAATPGQAGDHHGQAGDDHGQAGDDHGQAGDDHGQAGDDHGQAGQTHGPAGQ